jgi:hypothetical protein
VPYPLRHPEDVEDDLASGTIRVYGFRTDAQPCREEGEDLLLAHASGLFGRTTVVVAFNLAGQALPVRGKLQPLPVEARTDFTLIGFE